MTPTEVLADLFRAEIDLRLADDGVNLAAPAGRLTPAQREVVLLHKAALVQFLQEAHETTYALIESAMRACDHFNDGPAARQQMRADCEATPPHLVADLLAHFKQTYPESKT